MRTRRRSTKAPTSCSCGAATAWCSGASTPSGPNRSCSRSSRPVRATCSLTTSTSPSTSNRRSRSDSTERAARSTSGGQRRALRGDGGHRPRRPDDPRRRPGPEGSLRSRRVRLDRGEAPQDAAVPGADRGRRPPWFDGKAGCILVGNVGKVLGGVEAFDDAESRGRPARARGGHRQGRHPVDARVGADRGRAAPTGRSSCRRRRRKKIQVELDRKMPYELDGGDEKPATGSRSRSSRPRSRSAFPRWRHERRHGSSPRPGSSAATTRARRSCAPAVEARARRLRALPRVRRLQPRGDRWRS